MAVNYFGKRRLEKIFFHYISDRKDLITKVKADLKEFPKDIVMPYKKYKGSEWFEVGVYDEKNDIYIDFKFYVLNGRERFISIKEIHTKDCCKFDNPVEEVCEKFAYYAKDFYPLSGEPKLRCREVCKTSLTSETATVYQTEDGEHFSLEPTDNNGRYISASEHKGNVYKCTLPPMFYIGFSGERKWLFMKDVDVDVHICKNKNGLPCIKFMNRNHCDYDEFLQIEKEGLP